MSVLLYPLAYIIRKRHKIPTKRDEKGGWSKKKNFNNKYIAINSGIPKFNLSKREKDEEIT